MNVGVKQRTVVRRMKQLGYRFPVLQPLPTLSIRLPKRMVNWATAALVLGALVYAQCAIDIPGVDIPDLKDVPGVWYWLHENGIHQVQIDIFGLQ
jgi:hypothetical protein